MNQVNRHQDSAELAQLAANLRILLLDVDGVLTDGGIILIGGGLEAKRFDVQDGMGIGMLRAAGVMIGIVTSRTSQVVQRRAEEMNIEELFQGVRHKPDILDSILEKYGIEPTQAGFVGDDLQDIPLMRRIGLPIAVQNARPEVKENCVYVTQNPGGHGAVREIAEWLLELRGDKERVIQSITGLDTVAQH